MANCPNCGSDHITLKRETNVSWGRAVAGWALFGVVGGAVGAVTGKDRNVNACLTCGTSWRAEDLYKTLQTIKNLTSLSIDLTQENHRNFANRFVEEVGPYIEGISNAEKEALSTVKFETESKYKYTGLIGGIGSLIGLGGCTIAVMAGSPESSFAVIIFFGVIGAIIGFIVDLIIGSPGTHHTRIREAESKAKGIQQQAQAKLKQKIGEFLLNNPI